MSHQNYDSIFCNKQPLHLTSQIQPHGALLVVSKHDLKIVQVSDNVGHLFGKQPQELLNHSVREFLSQESFLEIDQRNKSSFTKISLSLALSFINNSKHYTYLSMVHEIDACIMIEIEFKNLIQTNEDTFAIVFRQLQQVMSAINVAKSIEEVASVAARQIKTLSGFDKVMIYSFDDEWNGAVIAEEMNEGMESYLGLKFPASDVPKQVRDLYLKCPYRIIPNREYAPAKLIPEINPITGNVTNLADCRLRSVIPVHLEYLHNMNIMASMSTRIIHSEKLWGLIACHHRTEKYLSFEECSILEFLSNIISSKISSVANLTSTENNIKLNSLCNHLVEHIWLHDNLITALRNYKEPLLSMLGADSVAICWNGDIETIGTTPEIPEIKRIRDWLIKKGYSKVIHVDSLAQVFEEALHYADVASGLLSLPIQPYEGNYILAFRAEAIKNITWGGDPGEVIIFDNNSTLYHPRNSFKIWKETVRNICTPWQVEELSIAERFRNVIVEHTLQALTSTLEKKVIERTDALLNSKTELEETHNELRQITYVATHDLQEPIRKIHIFGTKLKDFLEGKIPNEYLNRILISSIRISTLLRDLINYSRLTYTATASQTDLNQIVKEILSDFDLLILENKISFVVSDLPLIEAVPDQMRQVFYSLVSNSIKFCRPEVPSQIDIFSEFVNELNIESTININGPFCRIVVKDNGIGFNQEYAKQLFEIFKKLHGKEGYEGTGIGLAISKKIIEKHNGIIFGKGKENEGATFTIILPLKQHQSKQ